jgi:SNF2 family DNA or RNA helicase
MFKTTPRAHQAKAFELSADRESFALFMEMGTGKTKIAIDTAAHLYSNGRIDAVVVLAPNGVHRNWVLNEIPLHCPDHTQPKAMYYTAQPKAAERKAWDELHQHQGLRFFCFNIESASNKKGQEAIRKLVSYLRVLLVVDESHRIKTPGAKRTKFLLGISRHAEYRRILTGTPLTQSPLDFYAQLKFLDPTITGFTTFTGFRNHFAVVERRRTNNNRRGYYDHVVEYKNIDELEYMVAPHCFHVRKAECLDLPAKVYEKVYVELTPRQRALYEQLLQDSVAVLSNTPIDVPEELQHMDNSALLLFYADQKVTAGNALTKILRLQQIVCGQVPHDKGEEVEELPSNRLKTLLDVLEDVQGKTIIWARFRSDLQNIAQSLREQYGDEAVVEYHGGISNDDRVQSIHAFQHGEARFFVSQQHSGGVGLTLTAATTVIYYSNDYSLEARLQSEDRAHRIGQRHTVTYIDLVAQGTIDEGILDALAEKRRMAEAFNYGHLAGGSVD